MYTQRILSAFSILSVVIVMITATFASIQIDIPGPAGSGAFGTQVVVLPNGNIVVTDPSFDAPGPVPDVGAVYLYSGDTGALISTLTGSTANDQVGGGGTFGGVTVLTNGNYVVSSPSWDGTGPNVGAVTFGNATTGVSGAVSATNSLVSSSPNSFFPDGGVTALTNGNYVVRSAAWNGTAQNVGAVTWGNGTTGISGTISATNSLVGSTAGDSVGSGGVTVLTNGNYVVISAAWDGTAVNVGAVTWGNGTTGISGTVSETNSLVGSTLNDGVGVGFGGVVALTNGNYVVRSQNWDGTAVDAGAVTWGNGTTGISGTVSATNSLVGSTASDLVGNSGVTALTNGSYVVRSQDWDGTAANVGAVTWGNGTSGISGTVSATNSLVGSTASDQVGNPGVTVLSNGNYVVRSRFWDGAAVNVGAATFGNGTTGISGTVSSINSLVGSAANDEVGFGVTALTNGNYVVYSSNWNGPSVTVGAVTWGNGTTGITGAVSATNSVVGSTLFDNVGSLGVVALTNGNYVVLSPSWNGTAADVGAVTWGNGSTGISGTVSAANSVVGSTASDLVGLGGVRALSNGNYVVRSQFWDGTAANVGAVTFGNGTTGISGAVSAANSLVGSIASDNVGNSGVTALTNGNYVVISKDWDGTAANVGAVTFGTGTTGISGTVSASNSVVGSTANDNVGNGGVSALTNGNYVVRSSTWDNGGTADAGAVTYGNGLAGTTGTIVSGNSVRGMTTNAGNGLVFDFDSVNDQLVVGRSIENIVSFFRQTSPAAAPFDFDGDGRTDISIFRPSNGTWWIDQSTDGVTAVPFGLAGDVLAPADYDGDGKTDIAVWRPGLPNQARFYILNSSDFSVTQTPFGQTGDDPVVVGDWDGDGKADPAVYRDSATGSQSRFYFLGSNNNPGNNITFRNWGSTGDKAVKGDFDGDGKQDLAVFRPSTVAWWIKNSSDSTVSASIWGLSGDVLTPGDFDGDGKTDLAVYRVSESNFYYRQSINLQTFKFPWGGTGDIPVPGDYDGDGRIDPSVFRPSNGTWYINGTATGTPMFIGFGLPTDFPVPAASVTN